MIGEFARRQAKEKSLIAVYVVTFRRPALLKRALASVCAQTFRQWEVRVVNDDPNDNRVAAVVRELDDERIRLLEPQRKRGAAKSFNEAFCAADCEFSSLLEDDNWWEPEFLQHMVGVLERHPHVDVACANERIWTESSHGEWKDAGKTIWAFDGEREHYTLPGFACGSAMLCNSSMVVRRSGRPQYVTPDDIPVDVTEHFRERVVQQPVILVGQALANYAQTLITNRSTRGSLWGEYQAMLAATVFSSLPVERREVAAQEIFSALGPGHSPKASSMMSAAVCSPHAAALWGRASKRQRVRFLLGLARRPYFWYRLKTLRRRRKEHWEFLLSSRCNNLWSRGEQLVRKSD